jgi:hypothetical protein
VDAENIRDVYTFLAKQMQAEAGKNQAGLKSDVMKVLDCHFCLPCDEYIRGQLNAST